MINEITKPNLHLTFVHFFIDVITYGRYEMKLLLVRNIHGTFYDALPKNNGYDHAKLV